MPRCFVGSLSVEFVVLRWRALRLNSLNFVIKISCFFIEFMVCFWVQFSEF